jgi:hypothetical protein
MRYDLGWLLIALILANIGINLIRIVKTLCSKFYKHAKKIYEKCKKSFSLKNLIYFTKKHSSKTAKQPYKLEEAEEGEGDGELAPP